MTNQNQPRFSHFSGCHVNIVVSFAEHLELWECKRFISGVWWQSKTSEKVKLGIKNQETLHMENAKYRMLHKRKNIDASFAEHTKFKNK